MLPSRPHFLLNVLMCLRYTIHAERDCVRLNSGMCACTWKAIRRKRWLMPATRLELKNTMLLAISNHSQQRELLPTSPQFGHSLSLTKEHDARSLALNGWHPQRQPIHAGMQLSVSLQRRPCRVSLSMANVSAHVSLLLQVGLAVR